MKTVLNLALLVGCASAFSPSQQSSKASVSLSATTAELEAMIGPDVECGGKIVSIKIGHVFNLTFPFLL